MADTGYSRADEAARLEAALERIARARIGSPPGSPSASTLPAADRALLARRLDTLIAELRAVLGRDSAD